MRKFIAVVSLVFLILLGTCQPALADNCGSLSDCYGTIAVAAVVAAAIALAIALVVFLPGILAAAAEAVAVAEAGDTPPRRQNSV